jgi:hypothetical protein
MSKGMSGKVALAGKKKRGYGAKAPVSGAGLNTMEPATGGAGGDSMEDYARMAAAGGM